MTHTFKLSRRTARLRALPVAVLLALASACDNTDRLGPTDEASASTPTTATDSFDVPSFYTAATAPGIPVGVFGLPMSEYYNTGMWTGSLKHFTSGNATITELNAAKRYGARVVVSLAGGPTSYRNSDGTFSLSKWKYNVSKWKSVGLSAFIRDGTILAHYLIDEPQVASHWGGQRISNATVDEMARYSKSIWPTLATTVRARPANLSGYTWRYLDFAWAQWEGPLHVPSFRMTVTAWRDLQVAGAQRLGLRLMFGINYLDGGDGRSRIAGTYKNSTSSIVNRWQMSAAEVESVGKVLAAAPYACGLISWAWSARYPAYSYLTSSQLAGIRAFVSRSDVRTALARVASVAKNRTRTSCRRS